MRTYSLGLMYKIKGRPHSHWQKALPSWKISKAKCLQLRTSSLTNSWLWWRAADGLTSLVMCLVSCVRCLGCGWMVLRQKQGPELLPVLLTRIVSEIPRKRGVLVCGFLIGRSVAWAEHWSEKTWPCDLSKSVNLTEPHCAPFMQAEASWGWCLD